MIDQPQQNEFTEWKEHPFTQRFFRAMFFAREQNKEDWAKGMHVGDGTEQWALKNAEILGEVKAVETLLNLDMEQILQLETAANEYIRNQSRWMDGSS